MVVVDGWGWVLGLLLASRVGSRVDCLVFHTIPAVGVLAVRIGRSFSVVVLDEESAVQ